jgi:CheY-like chemotaxis protein
MPLTIGLRAVSLAGDGRLIASVSWAGEGRMKPHRILIVDDDPDFVANLSDILSAAGYWTESAACGDAALAKVSPGNNLQNGGFDLFLLDYKMPGMDGATLLEELRKQSPGVRAIMISSLPNEEGARRAHAANPWRLLSKPVDVRRLLEIVDEALLMN